MDETFRAGHGKTEKIPARSNFSLSADLNARASIGDVPVDPAHYVENRKRGTTGLGALLKGSADNVIELDKKSRDAKHG